MPLSRRRIIAAAMDLIERDGVEDVSLHRLATHLGCGLVSLCSYVPSTSALLDGVADALMSGMEVPPGGGSWYDQIRAQAHAFRATARARPRCAMLLVTRPPSSAAVLRPVERALATLRDAGFSSPDAASVIRALVAYVIGSVVPEMGNLARSGADDEVRRLPVRPGQFPHLTGLASEPTASNPDADFEFGLDLLVHSIRARQPSRSVAS